MKKFILLLLTATACSNFLDIDPPPTALTQTTVFETAETAQAAVNRIYLEMTQYPNTIAAGSTSINNLAANLADEFNNFSSFDDLGQFAQNSLLATNTTVSQNWINLYKMIYACNAMEEGVNQSNLLPNVKTPLIGEAKFMRAFLYFYLVNLWGDVPLALTTDYRTNTKLLRASMDDVYDQIILDLMDAQSSLPATSVQKIRPTSRTATALLARVYLYREQWTEAATAASIILNDNTLALETNLDNVFLKASTETIWQLQSVVEFINTWEGYAFVLISTPELSAIRQQVVDGFEVNDNRRSAWVKSYTSGANTWYYPNKYKVRTLPSATATKTEFLVVLRLAEQYLIRAEARTESGDLSGALSDLNMIRTRAGLSPYAALDAATLRTAIAQERRIELMAEWGHRWFDLKRTGMAASALSTVKSNWTDQDEWLPIPQQEINRNSRLTQNDGY